MLTACLIAFALLCLAESVLVRVLNDPGRAAT
jgi:hypothetical protein